jgi:hypothetical protein
VPQVCTVCKHAERAQIDRLLVEGSTFRYVAETYSLTPTSLHRHKKEHMPVELTKAKEAQDVADAGTLLGRVGALISRLERIATQAENDKQWLAASGSLREVGRLLRLLGELSGELGTGPTINVSVHLQRSLSVVLRAAPDEFLNFWKTILKEATQPQLNALLTADETKQALCTIPFYDSLLDEEAVNQAARDSLSDEDCAALESINAKLQHFRDDHQSVKVERTRIVLSETEMAL